MTELAEASPEEGAEIELPPLFLAINEGNATLAESILKEMQPLVGVEYLVVTLQRYLIFSQTIGTLTEGQSNLALDLMGPLREALTTLDDGNYIAPNLSPEVAELLLYVSGPLLTAALDHMSPGWVMVKRAKWVQLLKLAKAASERHAQ